MSNFDTAFDVVLGHEGGFVDHDADPGGATNFGISLRYLLGRGDLDGDGVLDGDLDGDGDVDIDDIIALTPAHSKHLYHTGFWVPNRLPQVTNNKVATKIFDIAVNTGSRQAWRIVQRACNTECEPGDELEVDGKVGPKTLGIVNAIGQKKLIDAIRKEQLAFYENLVERKPSLAVFLNGWTNRALA